MTTTEKLFNKLAVTILFLLLIGFFAVPKAHATLSNISDTITTSRPSAAAALSAGIKANDTQAQISDNSLNMFLASDSAVIYPDTGETIDTGKNVASMSAVGIPSGGNRYVYLNGLCPGPGCFASIHHAPEALIVNVTAMHTISFTTSTAVPGGGTIVLTFPGTGSNTASPSATGFSFNGMAASSPSDVKFNGVTCSSVTVAAPSITCTSNGSGVSAGATVTVLIGCTSATGATCNTQAPRLINPLKSSAAGTADLWKIQLQVANTNNDTAKITIGTIESVQVQATVDPTLTFAISAVSGAVNNGNTGCSTTDTVNSGIVSTPTSVNLGLLNTTTINIAAQLITVSTNGRWGYALTATSSGHLMDPTSGFSIRDSGVSPARIAAQNPWFGIHPCGADVSTSGMSWGSSNVAGDVNTYFGWPTPTAQLKLAALTTGPVGVSGSTAGLTSVEYAGAVDVSVPAGLYFSTITYTATPTF